MAPRKRLSKNKGLPEHLYAFRSNASVYYRYKHPVTGKYHGMGNDKAKAIAAAKQLNAMLIKEVDLVQRALGQHEQTIARLVERYQDEYLPDKKLSPSTLKLYEYRLKRFSDDLGSEIVSEMRTKFIAEYLDENFSGNSYTKHRNTLIDLFRFAITKGWVTTNPAEVTYSRSEGDKKRQRMTLEQFLAIHKVAPPWMQNAMELALVTLQGRHEICSMKFEDIQDGYLYITREKTKKNEWAHIRIEVTKDIEAIVKRARLSGVVSPYIIHRDPERRNRAKGRDHWTQITLNDFSARFRELRDDLKLFQSMDKELRPTFHEIRALGSWLYEKAGHETGYVQKLMAHGDEKMTEYYQSGHEVKWLEARAELNLRDILE